MRVCDVRPGSDVIDTGAVLMLHSRANISEFSILKDEEVVALGEGLERSDKGDYGARGDEGDYVDVGFNKTDFGTEFCPGHLSVCVYRHKSELN